MSDQISQHLPATLEMARTFSAPIERVFEAFSTFDAMSRWFGPEGCDVIDGALNFEVGGRYRLVLNGHDEDEKDAQYVIGGVYQEISRPERIVFSWQWEHHAELHPDPMEVTIALKALSDDETELSLIQTGIPTQELAEEHHKGWSSTFVCLGRTY